jgi:hypothetical protein
MALVSPPKAGDITICDQCGTWLVFTIELLLRRATVDEIARIEPRLRRIAEEAITQ